MSMLASQIANLPEQRTGPLWQGPCGDGLNGGVTQSMIARWLACRERFRIKYVLGLEPTPRWNKPIGFGNMWHICEEAHAANKDHSAALLGHAHKQCIDYPMDREEIDKWFNICSVQFPEYVKYWSEHPDVLNRTPLMQEQAFDVPYKLPSGRVVRLRGKFDSVDLIDGGIYLQENKTKSEIDKIALERQLKFDLQTMLYLIALESMFSNTNLPGRVRGVRYNVVRRDCPIRKHKEKCTKPRYGTGKNSAKLLDPGKITPAETDEHFYERLLNDYIRAEPDQWFFRLRSEVTAKDINEFKRTCLDPILEQMCWWYESVTGVPPSSYDNWEPALNSLNYRMPFGLYNPLYDSGATEYDAFLETGSRAGMVETKMFTELQDAPTT